MWHSRALAVAAVAAALLAGPGCVTRSAYQRDLAAEQARTEAENSKNAALQAKLDQAAKDIRKAQDTLSEEAADYTANQKAADAARGQVAGLKRQIEQLQNSAKDAEKNAKAAADKAEKASKDEADKLRKLQDQADAAQKENAALHELVEKQKAQIAELKAQLDGKSSLPAPTAAPVQSAK
jgi:chromosome segregation ATPase